MKLIELFINNLSAKQKQYEAITLQLHEYLTDKITQFEVTKIELPRVARHVAASRSLAGHEKMIAEFNRALAATRKDGSLQKIIQKWDERYGGIE